jgi:hypothetical protein
MVKTFCPFAGDRARRAERPVLTQGRALVAFGRVSAWAALCRALCAFFGPLGKVLVVFCDPEHRFLGRYVAHKVCHSPRLFCALSPVFRAVEDGRRRLGIHSAAPSTAHRVYPLPVSIGCLCCGQARKLGRAPEGLKPWLAKPGGGERRGSV